VFVLEITLATYTEEKCFELIAVRNRPNTLEKERRIREEIKTIANVDTYRVSTMLQD